MKKEFLNKTFTPVSLTTRLKTGDWLRTKKADVYEFYQIGIYSDRPKGYEIKLNGRDNLSRGLVPVLSLENMIKDKWEIMVD